MARTSTSRRRFVAGALGIALTAAAGGGAVVFTSGSAGARTGSGATGESAVIVCESGTVSHDGVDTSSAVAVRVPAGTPVPPGCRTG